tara:strand:- start:322 stop:498 length:177 start_codon:yes stop_codon:yes gene_type:complete
MSLRHIYIPLGFIFLTYRKINLRIYKSIKKKKKFFLFSGEFGDFFFALRQAIGEGLKK